LLAVWALVVVAIPTASPSFAYSLIKPENPEMNLLRARVSVDHPRPQMDSLNRATIRGEFAKHGIDLANQRSIVWTEEKMRAARSITALNDPLYYQVQCRDLNTVFDQLTKQELRVDWLSTWFARLSPYGCLQNGCTSFAGTGFSHEVALREQLQSLSQARADHTVEHFKNLGSVDDMRPETFPQFTPPGEPLVRALESGLPDLALMALMCVLFFMAGFTAFLRMEVQ
jgi:hypothetical protein